jgi:hypothetical protein
MSVHWSSPKSSDRRLSESDECCVKVCGGSARGGGGAPLWMR